MGATNPPVHSDPALCLPICPARSAELELLISCLPDLPTSLFY